MRVYVSLLILLLLICAMFPGIFTGKSIFPSDLLFFYEPWKTEFNSPFNEPSNWLLFDEVLEFYPWRQHMCQAIESGRIPFWDPSAFCGFPFIATFQTAFLYPPDRISDWMPFPLYCNFRSLLHLLIAGTGAALYFKRNGFSGIQITLGTFTFAFSGFMIVWLGHPHVKSAAWLPWIYLALDECFKNRGKGLFWISLVTFMTISAGHAETTMHVLTAGMLYFLLNSIFRKYQGNSIFYAFIKCGIGLFVAFLISGLMTVPFAEYLSHSVAYDVRKEGVVVQPYLDKVLFLAQFAPDIFGNSSEGNYWYPGFHTAEINGGYVGVIPVILALVSVFRKPLERYHFIHGLIVLWCIGVAYKIPLIYQITEMIPGYKMSYNFRLLLPMSFSLIALAVSALRAIEEKQKGINSAVLIASLLVVLIVSVAPFVLPIQLHDLQIPESLVNKSIIEPLLLAIVMMLSSLLFMSGRIKPQFIAGLWIVLAAYDLVGWGSKFNTVLPASILQAHPESAELLRHDTESEIFRVLPIGYTYPPHTPQLYDIHDIRGNDALTPRLVEDYVALIQPEIRAKTMLPAMRMLRLEQFDSRLLDALNIKYIVTDLSRPPIISRHIQFERTAGGVRIYKNLRAQPRAFTVTRWISSKTPEETLTLLSDSHLDLNNEAVIYSSTEPTVTSGVDAKSGERIVQYSAHTIQIQCSGTEQRLLVLSDSYFPGWQASVDGNDEEIIQVNHMMRGVFLKPGDHTVEFRYNPVSARLGMFLTLCGAMLFTFLFRLARWMDA